MPNAAELLPEELELQLVEVEPEVKKEPDWLILCANADAILEQIRLRRNNK